MKHKISREKYLDYQVQLAANIVMDFASHENPIRVANLSKMYIDEILKLNGVEVENDSQN